MRKFVPFLLIFLFKSVSGRFDTSGSMIPCWVPEILPLDAFCDRVGIGDSRSWITGEFGWQSWRPQTRTYPATPCISEGLSVKWASSNFLTFSFCSFIACDFLSDDDEDSDNSVEIYIWAEHKVTSCVGIVELWRCRTKSVLTSAITRPRPSHCCVTKI